MCVGVVVMKYHTIKGHRCEVKKALSKEDLQQQGQGGGGGMRGGNYLPIAVSFTLVWYNGSKEGLMNNLSLY